MSRWLQISLNFKNCQKTMLKMADEAKPHAKPQGSYKELIRYLKNVVEALGHGLINRYFYFFEPKPHLFLALEVKDKTKINLIKEKINSVKKPNSISSTKIELSNDDGKGDNEITIDFFHAATKFSFFRVSDKYKPIYTNNDETKLVHCFCNQLFVTPKNEIKFYSHGINIWKNYLAKQRKPQHK